MTYDAQAAIELARSFEGKVTYSMDWDKRDGVNYFDCSGFVYYILAHSGAIDDSYLKRSHYTGTLKADLEAAGFVEVSGDEVQAGDVFIWGGNYGEQAGGACHTGFMTSNSTEISSCYYTLGGQGTAIQELNHDYYWGLDGKPEYHFFHYQGGTPANVTGQDNRSQATGQAYAAATSIDKFKAGGDEFVLKDPFKIETCQLEDGIYQVQSEELAADPFDWKDNGIATKLLVDLSGTRNFDDGAQVKFTDENNHGTIDEYDREANAVGIDFKDGNGVIWFDADKFWNHQ